MRHPGLRPAKVYLRGDNPRTMYRFNFELMSSKVTFTASHFVFGYPLLLSSLGLVLRRSNDEENSPTKTKKIFFQKIRSEANEGDCGKKTRNSEKSTEIRMSIISLSVAVPKPYGFQGATSTLASCPGLSNPGCHWLLPKMGALFQGSLPPGP